MTLNGCNSKMHCILGSVERKAATHVRASLHKSGIFCSVITMCVCVYVHFHLSILCMVIYGTCVYELTLLFRKCACCMGIPLAMKSIIVKSRYL